MMDLSALKEMKNLEALTSRLREIALKAEIAFLRGKISESEREIMESHALMTEEILKKVHFNSSFKNAGKWAAQHHECLNGKATPTS